MFTITNKLRTFVVISAVGASLASAGAASAALPVHQPGTALSVVARQPAAIAETIDPGKVGSAGVPGYDNQACEALANEFNGSITLGDQRAAEGNYDAALVAFQEASDAKQELQDNCMVMDGAYGE
jgi:hypothetical protein